MIACTLYKDIIVEDTPKFEDIEKTPSLQEELNPEVSQNNNH